MSDRWVQSPALAPTPLMQTLRSSDDSTSDWVAATRLGSLGGVPSYSFCPGQAPAAVGLWAVRWQVGSLSLSPSFCLPSTSQINALVKKKKKSLKELLTDTSNKDLYLYKNKRMHGMKSRLRIHEMWLIHVMQVGMKSGLYKVTFKINV